MCLAVIKAAKSLMTLQARKGEGVKTSGSGSG